MDWKKKLTAKERQHVIETTDTGTLAQFKNRCKMEGLTMDMDTAGILGKLSGMAYAQGSYTTEQWKYKTGINCADFRGLIRIDQRGRCFWTKEAEAIYQAWSAQTRNNRESLGIN